MRGLPDGARGVARRDERGASATEYGLLALLIALVIFAGVTLFGEALNTAYEGWASAIADAL